MWITLETIDFTGFFDVSYVDNYVDNLWTVWITYVDKFFVSTYKNTIFQSYPHYPP